MPNVGTTIFTSMSALAETPGSKLFVGINIKLKGVEISDCDTLVVEGSVEATMDSRVIQISERGSFKGSADIDIAVDVPGWRPDLKQEIDLIDLAKAHGGRILVGGEQYLTLYGGEAVRRGINAAISSAWISQMRSRERSQ